MTELSQTVIGVKHHTSEFEGSLNVYKIEGMSGASKYPFADQGRRLRLLRQAERIPSGSAFAVKFRWPQSAVSQFETGIRRVPLDKAFQLRQAIPGFDPLWLYEGTKTGLSFDLRQRIEAEEAKEEDPQLAVRDEG